ncbi:hypothetical protein [Sphingobacterium wenxiniae]|uniref:Secreted protein n=1 Tax=Sphingobacterium wenxiniae TaxID=683125 RepID=A0A1I6UA32_9SPHI|nr:hypothetical protein [Sphingobacterium wenxiniae]SFS98300.1 hypothetical protein SAMN05660206_10881 [Sphingobacterium wenxiniae]
MLKKQIVKKTSLFTLILAFMVTTVAANASVMNGDNEKGKDGGKGKTEQVEEAEKTLIFITWYFTGGEGDDPTDPNNYSTSLPPGQSCDTEIELICQINAPNQGGKPQMDAPVPGTTGETVETQIRDVQDELDSPNGTPHKNATVLEFRSK